MTITLFDTLDYNLFITKSFLSNRDKIHIRLFGAVFARCLKIIDFPLAWSFATGSIAQQLSLAGVSSFFLSTGGVWSIKAIAPSLTVMR